MKLAAGTWEATRWAETDMVWISSNCLAKVSEPLGSAISIITRQSAPV
jgi:hypothetical protein